MKDNKQIRSSTIFMAITIIGTLIFCTVREEIGRVLVGLSLEESKHSWEGMLIDYVTDNIWCKMIYGFGLGISLFFLIFAFCIMLYKTYCLWFTLEEYNTFCRQSCGGGYQADQTQNYLIVLLLSLVIPFWIYPMYWFNKQAKKLDELARQRGTSIQRKPGFYIVINIIPQVLELILLVITIILIAGEDGSSAWGYMTKSHYASPYMISCGLCFFVMRLHNAVVDNLCWGMFIKDMENVTQAGGYQRGYAENDYDMLPGLMMQPQQPRVPAKMPVRKIEPDMPTQAVGSVQILTGQYKNAVLPVKSGEEIVLGRDRHQCHLIFENTHVSRVHCGVRYSSRENLYLITDRSTNGTFLTNGNRFVKDQPTKCRRGTVIVLGKSGEKFIVR